MDFLTFVLIGVVVICAVVGVILWKNKHRKIEDVVEDKYNDLKDAAEKTTQEVKDKIEEVKKKSKRKV